MVKQSDQARKEPAYPYYHWKPCIGLAEAVAKCGGRQAGVSRKVLAKELKMGETSPSLSQLIASAKVFGMIQGWGTYRLTENGERYFFPTNETEKLEATIAFFSSPSAFRSLIERFDGQSLPAAKTIGHILLREKTVPASWSERAAGIFRNAADELGLIDAGGRLRYKAAKAVKDLSQAADQFASTFNSTPPKTSVTPARSGMNTWVFTEAGGTVKLETPDPLPLELWQRLQKYVQAIEPTKQRK